MASAWTFVVIVSAQAHRRLLRDSFAIDHPYSSAKGSVRLLSWSAAVKLGVPAHDDQEDCQFDHDHNAL